MFPLHRGPRLPCDNLPFDEKVRLFLASGSAESCQPPVKSRKRNLRRSLLTTTGAAYCSTRRQQTRASTHKKRTPSHQLNGESTTKARATRQTRVILHPFVFPCFQEVSSLAGIYLIECSSTPTPAGERVLRMRLALAIMERHPERTIEDAKADVRS